LPYIPDSFLEQKRTKTTRKRRRADSNPTDIENINFTVSTPEWTILGKQPEERKNKEDIFHLIRSVITYSDNNENFQLANEFEHVSIDDIQNNDELRKKMKSIISFIYFYCRGELGFFKQRSPIPISDLQSWLSNLNS
jgi:hypothetical protein